MAFYGCQFNFDGIPSFDYGLMLYDIDGITEDGTFSSGAKIIEDRTATRYSPLHYGITQNEPLKFTLTFGADVDAVENTNGLDRWEMEAIASWLTGHDQYKYLEIVQPDLDVIRYKCIITNLEYTTYGKMPWAFTCEVTCDSPFAYLAPETFRFSSAIYKTGVIRNRASCKYYYPKMSITVSKGSSVSIINHSDNDRTMTFSDIEGLPITIYIDNENEVITNSKDINLYDKFNFNFFRLVRGYNDLEFTGTAVITFDCEFPINIGG